MPARHSGARRRDRAAGARKSCPFEYPPLNVAASSGLRFLYVQLVILCADITWGLWLRSSADRISLSDPEGPGSSAMRRADFPRAAGSRAASPAPGSDLL